MKMKTALSFIAVINLAFGSGAIAAGAKTYKITGTIVSSTSSRVVVQKDSERFEFDVDPATVKGSAELKVGSTVTVTYVMSATKIESAGGETSSPASTSPSP